MGAGTKQRQRKIGNPLPVTTKNKSNLAVETMLEPNNIRMPILHQQPHNLQFSILKPFILQNFLNRHNFPRFDHRSLKDHAEASIADDSFGRVGNRVFGNWTVRGSGRGIVTC